MRVADVVAKTLVNFGVRRAFGMPGGEVLTLIDALNEAGIAFTLARHETAAAIMAAGAFSVTGMPGLLVTTLGPGLTNAVNGIADAAQEHVPLIVLSGVVDHDIRGRYTHQIIDQKGLLKSLVKGSFEIEREGAGAVVARAVALATALPMGPVHIDIAPGLAEQGALPKDLPVLPVCRATPSVRSDDPSIIAVREALRSAQRPLVIVGAEAVTSGASGPLRTLAERFGAPVLTTYKAKGVIAETHALSLGAAGLSPLADSKLLPLVRAADVVVLAGYDPIEMRPGWLDPFGPSAHVIELTAHAPDHAMHQAAVCLTGSLPSLLDAILNGADPRSDVWAEGEIETVQAALRAAFKEPDGWGPHRAIAELQTALPHDAIITVDSGAHRILLSQMLAMSEPGRLLQSAGFCTMGAAIPLAAGAKAMSRETPIVAVLGDGGLEMGLGELATLRDEKLGIVIVVFQDESLALIELKQRKAGLSDLGVRLGATPFEVIADAFGGYGVRVSSAPAFGTALKQAFARDTFSLIVCDIKAGDYVDRI